MLSRTLYIAVFFLIASATGAPGAENCTVCHKVHLSGVHGKLSCLACHLSETSTVADPGAAPERARGCTGCHKGYQRIFDGAMGRRDRERAFVGRSFAAADPRFYEKNCAACHLEGCLDCHGGDGHAVAKPRDADCNGCHKGYFTGWDYHGRAPREENLRYRRGYLSDGEPYLKMAPDVHAEAGMRCSACHGMQSLLEGKKGRACLECHRVDRSVLEHGIAAHLEKLECYACHSAWAPQEYGTFYLRGRDAHVRVEFDLEESGEYMKSVYLKKQDAPPLGLNDDGKVSPIRPQFIAYFSEVGHNATPWQNRLLAAEWKAFFPHTVRRGTPMCDACHDNPSRFLLEKADDRIYQLKQDGMGLDSFWDRTGQKVINGSFLPHERYRAMSVRSAAYQRGYVKKWQKLVTHVGHSSAP